MDAASQVSSSSESVRHKEYVLPIRSQLYLQSRIQPLNSEKSFQRLWQTQSILVMAHIFEALEFMEVHVSDEEKVQFEGKELEKPCLILTRKGIDDTLVYEIETDISRIICEHLYKYYIFTHQVEKPSERVARPVVFSDPTLQTSQDPSEWVVQPKNSNALVRKLRGKRKAALQVRIQLTNCHFYEKFHFSNVNGMIIFSKP